MGKVRERARHCTFTTSLWQAEVFIPDVITSCLHHKDIKWPAHTNLHWKAPSVLLFKVCKISAMGCWDV